MERLRARLLVLIIHIFTLSYQEFPLALVRKPDCFCGYATPHFTLHEPVKEELCAVENSSLPTQSSHQLFLQVYQTPVQGKTVDTFSLVLIIISVLKFPYSGCVFFSLKAQP